MQYVESGCMGDFVAFYDDVEMVSVARSSAQAMQGHAATLLNKKANLQHRWTQPPGDSVAAAEALALSMPSEMRSLFVDEIAAATDVLGELLGCDEVGVRLMILRRPMCPRFHIDAVPCRLLIAVDGPGTQWIGRDDVDSQLFENRNSKVPPCAAIQQLMNGAWALMKGGAWQDGFDGVVHSSPQDGKARLLISMDPLFTVGASESRSHRRSTN